MYEEVRLEKKRVALKNTLSSSPKTLCHSKSSKEMHLFGCQREDVWNVETFKKNPLSVTERQMEMAS